jgi:NADH dehydrogenase FAD-containing subunit
MADKHGILILGGGFAGVETAAEALPHLKQECCASSRVK